jgi:thiopeptide-type bacteriocin biosynthesis protein
MGWLLEFVREAESQPGVARLLQYHRNAYVLAKGGRKYVRHPDPVLRLPDGSRANLEYRPPSIRSSAIIDDLLRLAAKPCLYRDLVGSLQSNGTVGPQQAENMVNQLIAGGFLVSELRPNPTRDPAGDVLRALERVESPAATTIKSLIDALADVSRESSYDRLHQCLREVSVAGRSVHVEPVYQVDMTHLMSGALPRAVVEDAAQLADFQMRSSLTFSMSGYRSRFYDFYRSYERCVPLLEMVDDVSGIGPPPYPIEGERHVDASRILRLVSTATTLYGTSQVEIELSEPDLELMLGPSVTSEQAPRDVDVGFFISAESAESVSNGIYQLLPSPFGATQEAGQAIGRFARMLGTNVEQTLREMKAAPDREAVDAELVLSPARDRSSNVAIRPNVHEYAVTYGAAHDPTVVEIPLDDLMVGIGGSRFILWSKTLGKQVRIRAGSALNLERNAPAACNFLWQVALDGRRLPGRFVWGPECDALPMLPRLRFGRIILSLARWKLPREVAIGSAAAKNAAFATWRQQWRVPRYVYLVQNGRHLPLDLDSPLSSALIRFHIEKAGDASWVVLEEAYGQEWLGEDDQRVRAEFVVSLKNAQPMSLRQATPVLTVENEMLRTAVPGDRWSFLKLYCVESQIDTIVAHEVGPLMADLMRRLAVESWFFVRYADPRKHIRVRAKAVTDETSTLVLSELIAFARSLVLRGILESFEVSTYERELERYGGAEGCKVAEALFGEDTCALGQMLGTWGDDYERRLVDGLSTFHHSLFRDLPVTVQSAVIRLTRSTNRKTSPEERRIVRTVQERVLLDLQSSARLSETVPRLAELAAANKLSRPLEEVVLSILHMHANRLGIKSGKDERVYFNLLSHAYDGVAARQEGPENAVSGPVSQ